MKKKGLVIGMAFSLVVCLCLALFCACGETKTNTGDTGSGDPSAQQEIYEKYVAYATAAGDDVLSYEEWLDSIRGKDGKDGLNGKDGKDGSDGQNGKDGTDGKSAYDIWLENGHSGSESDFLDWLKGEKGETGAQGAQGQKGEDGADGKYGKDGQDGTNGQDGKSAYDIWQENGHSGTEAEFLEWLKGEQGEKGQDGQDGKDGINGTDGKDGVNGQDGKDGVDGKDGKDGLSAFDIFKKYYPFYDGSEEEWIADLVNGNLTIYKVTFKSEVAEDIVRRVFTGRDLTDIPDVPEKEGQASAKWDREDFTNITSDIEVHAVYTMKQLTVTFHNEYTEEEDETRTVEYGQAIEDVPTVKEKIGNSGVWDVTDFSRITEDMTVNAVYETEGLAYTLINNQQEYRVSAGTMNKETEELFIPAVHDEKPVTVIAENAFSVGYTPYGYKFKIAYLPESIMEMRAFAFYCCRQLESIKIPSKVTTIEERAFTYCDLLTTVEMSYVTEIGGYAFEHCDSLTTVKMPQVATINAYAFSSCHSLATVEMPQVTSIGYDVFSDCTALEHLEIPSGVTTIKWYLFSNCTSLKYVILPSGITTIESDVFKGCTVFEAIYFKGSKEAWSALDKSNAGDVFNEAKVTTMQTQCPKRMRATIGTTTWTM